MGLGLWASSRSKGNNLYVPCGVDLVGHPGPVPVLSTSEKTLGSLNQ